MNYFQREQLLQELSHLEDTLTICRLMAVGRVKNGDIEGAYQMITYAQKTIRELRDRFFK